MFLSVYGHGLCSLVYGKIYPGGVENRVSTPAADDVFVLLSLVSSVATMKKTVDCTNVVSSVITRYYSVHEDDMMYSLCAKQQALSSNEGSCFSFL